MKNTAITLLVIMLTMAVPDEGVAYRNDVVNIQESNQENARKPADNSWRKNWGKIHNPSVDGTETSTATNTTASGKDKSPEATRIAAEAAKAMKIALLKDFPCLSVYTTSERKNKVAELKRRQIVGPAGEQWVDAAKKKDPSQRNSHTTREEEEVFQETISKEMNDLSRASDAKYFVSVVASAKPLVTVDVIAVSRFWTNRAGWFYRENKIYPDVDAAMADVTRIADELVDALVENAANEPIKNNEVCPFKGKVEVRAITKRKQEKEDKFFEYCNGQDREGRKTESFVSDGQQLWQLERLGNPDTTGTMQGSMAEKFVHEEINGCHECASGRKGEWMFSDVIESAVSASELDTSTVNMVTGLSDNKDATVRLHFFKDGTYKIAVRGVSKEANKYITHTTTAAGTCDNMNQGPKTEKQTITMPLEQQFGPFNGSVRDKNLKEKHTVTVGKDGTDEVTEYTIEFDLKRPEKK